LKLGVQDWECAGRGPGHKADLERIASCYRGASVEIEVQRCRSCGLHYHVCQSEISDWSGGRDYSDQTTVWIPLDPDEIEAPVKDSNYRPRRAPHHRHDTGWQ
jgi:hypothetical protein